MPKRILPLLALASLVIIGAACSDTGALAEQVTALEAQVAELDAKVKRLQERPAALEAGSSFDAETAIADLKSSVTGLEELLVDAISGIRSESTPELGQGDLMGEKPMDAYACLIDEHGYCIFTGTPHENGLQPGAEDIVDRAGTVLFTLQEAIAVNADGAVLEARGAPAFDGDHLVQGSHETLSDDEKAFHRVMATMFPIRNALMYDIATLTEEEWDQMVAELESRGIKDTTFTDGATPRDNFYGRQGVFDLAKSPGGKDIHHEVMKFLEEAGVVLLCHVTSDEFAQMLQETHPEGHDPCVDAGIVIKVPF